MQRREVLRTAIAAGAVSLGYLPRAMAQGGAWPQRPVRMVVPYPAGSSPDVVARLLATRVETVLGQPIVIDNKGGAGGTLGTGLVAKAAPDDHTFVFTTQSPLVTAPRLMKQLSYDPVADLAPVTQVAKAPFLLVADSRLGVNNLGDFVRLARRNSGTYNYASTGIGQGTHLAMELFKSRADLSIVHVPYQSSPQAVTAMLAGQIQVSFMVPSVAVGHLQAGKLVALGMTSAQRLASMPEVPTIAEQGYPDFEAVAWHAVLAPGRTSPAVVERFATELNKVITSPEFKATLQVQHFAASGTGPAELATVIQRETVMWGKVIQAAGIQPE
ncbi:Bug family tripartite tricarboxylate transporter substrate binding protein [Hydrogenophaga sp.]|uniref:Bug family tripartite tricarboxylate transporter substrate binding protein n=1 Tax=Hydrogenophaga sp. TaxID=1904254 RepID=UPI003F716111